MGEKQRSGIFGITEEGIFILRTRPVTICQQHDQAWDLEREHFIGGKKGWHYCNNWRFGQCRLWHATICFQRWLVLPHSRRVMGAKGADLLINIMLSPLHAARIFDIIIAWWAIDWKPTTTRPKAASPAARGRGRQPTPTTIADAWCGRKSCPHPRTKYFQKKTIGTDGE